MPPDLVTTVTDAAATYRLVRLAQLDTLPPIERSREAIVALGSPTLIELLDCPWCLSVWVALLVIGLRRCCPKLWSPLATALAYSALVGIIRDPKDR